MTASFRLAALLAAATVASAATAAGAAGYRPTTPRGVAAYALVRRWSGHVQKTYGTPPQRWAASMRTTFARAPLDAMQAAAKAETFDAAMATLSGTARGPAAGAAKAASAHGAPANGVPAKGAPAKADVAVVRNLLYTMITPCRILDTRTIARPLVAGEARAFGFTNGFTSDQGGSYCNIPAGASALTLNITVVDPGAAGYLTVYPNDGLSRPLASSLNYKAGDIVGNEIIARQVVDDVAPYTTPSFRIYSYAATHVVVDVSGYFTPPAAEPLQCVEVNSAQATVAPNATARATAPACPAGYSATGGGCVSNVYPSVNGLYFSNFGPTADSPYVCDGNNRGATAVTFIARGACCRVPGG